MTENELELLVIKAPGISLIDTSYSPLCRDKKIHVRLQDYDKPMIIAGFEDKLEFLITWLFHKETSMYFTKGEIDKFMQLDSVEHIRRELLNGIFDAKSYDCLKVGLCYKKNRNINYTTGFMPSQFYNMDGCLNTDDDIRQFLSIVDSKTILGFLLNDAIELSIVKKVHKDPNKKYRNKSKNKMTTIDLW